MIPGNALFFVCPLLQKLNHEDAIGRLVALIRRAAEKPRPRKKTRPSLAFKERRIEGKKQRGLTKKMRKTVSDID